MSTKPVKSAARVEDARATRQLSLFGIADEAQAEAVPAARPLRPFFHFFGAKWSAGSHYPPPEHPIVVEPFAGSAGYALRHWQRNVILVERDPVIAGVWRYLLGAPASEIRSLPLFTKGGPYDIDSLGPMCEEARHLIGFWIVVAVSAPAKKCGAWMRKKIELPPGSHGTAWGDTFWSARMRERIASQVDSIRHWRLLEGSYEIAPDIAATWFIDPPYQVAGKGYKFHGIDYVALGEWCRSRRGQVMVCENMGANWLPFVSIGRHKSTKGKSGANGSHEGLWQNLESDDSGRAKNQT